MFLHQTRIRVRYSETDKMGFVYYGHYAQYFEVGRAEAIRSLGISYAELEQQGIMMPVQSMEVQYLRPARYDDELTIHTHVPELPDKSISFRSKIFNAKDKLLTEGVVTLVFINQDTGRRCAAPKVLLDLLKPWYI